MKNKISKHLTSFEDHLDAQYGIRGTKSTEKNMNRDLKPLKLGVLIQCR